MPIATSAEDARVMLEALEAGTDGVVLQTQEPAQASSYLKIFFNVPLQHILSPPQSALYGVLLYNLFPFC